MRKLLWALLIAFSVVSFISCASAAPEPEDGMEDVGGDSESVDITISTDTSDKIDVRELLAFSPKLVEIYDEISRIWWETGKWVTDLLNGDIPPIYHDHIFGDRMEFREEDRLPCEEKLFYRVCLNCNFIEWTNGNEDDHVLYTETKYDCIEGSYDVIGCKLCSKTEITNVIPNPDSSATHVYVDHGAKEPTCSESGWNQYQTCERCDYTSFETVPALGHAYVDHDAKEPTCSESGWNQYQTCERCDYTSFTEVYALGHDYVNHKAKSPTCSEVGWQEYQTCKNCDFSTYYELGTTEHNVTSDMKCSTCGQKTLYYRDGSYIYFGEYPQTIKSSSVTVGYSTDSRGYYLGSDGNYYAKVVADPYGSGYKFSDNSSIYYSTTYYFKVEPIRWRILTEESGNALILCDSIIDTTAYDSYNDNNYSESGVRVWLNDTFYDTAFSKLQQKIILETTVDNSAYSTGSSSNFYACEDTYDKLFLLSYVEATNSSYNLSYTSDRRVLSSDYARAIGLYISTSSSYYGNGYWWLRSPYSSYSYNVRYVSYSGSISYTSANYYNYGVVPALWIDLDNIIAYECTHSETETVYENVTDANCTEDGSHDEVVCCATCGEELSRESITLPALGHEYSDTRCVYCGISSVAYTVDNGYILFGEYPQTIKASGVTVSDTPSPRGYYLGSDGNYYAKVVSNPYSSGYQFSDDSTVTSGDVYYFKVEPIRWRVLTVSGNNVLILCDSIIDTMAYDADNNNNYAGSDVRAWLNETFYKTAFSEIQRELILATTVDNSANSTGYTYNSYVCEDTYDNLFLLSYSDIVNSDYGFQSSYNAYDTARRMKSSDYTRANGIYMSTSGSYYGNSYWWLRSPHASNNYYARLVYFSGEDNAYDNANNACHGVVPAMWMYIEDVTLLECAHSNTKTVEETGRFATCTVNGRYDEVVYCTSCNEELSRTTHTVPATGHTATTDFTCDVCGVATAYYRKDDYIYFGEYPQSLKASSVSVTSTKDSRGYYLGSDGNYYARVVADTYDGGYRFSNNSTIYDGTTYYFKVEPIRWRILTEESGKALILCDSIIDNTAYDDGSNNNYADSDVRAWLNSTFYETAFSELQRGLILTTTVDNGVYSTGYSTNSRVSDDTYDKVFLLSYREATNSEYGFSSSIDRQIKTTDYTRAKGAYIVTNNVSYYGNGYWWLRSPYYNNSISVRYADGSGILSTAYCNYNYFGVVPALWITL